MARPARKPRAMSRTRFSAGGIRRWPWVARFRSRAGDEDRVTNYAMVIEKGENNYSAYVPDLPGCVSVGDTLEEITAQIREAIAFHLEGMREDGAPPPRMTGEPTAASTPPSH